VRHSHPCGSYDAGSSRQEGTREIREKAARTAVLPNSEIHRTVGQTNEKLQKLRFVAQGTQTVFGEGSSRAKIMMIGEQPGNEEDRQRKPFVRFGGPAVR
jgi:uracil-DNA glycosylase